MTRKTYEDTLVVKGNIVMPNGDVLDPGAFSGVTASAAEINLNDGAVAGTAVASKTLALGANKNVDEIHTAALYLGAAAGTLVTATAAELNLIDGSVAGTAVASKAAVLGANKNLDEIHTAALYLGAAAGTLVTPSAAEINVLDGAPNGAHTFTIGAEAANAINVAIQLKDAAGGDVGQRCSVFAYLSDDANGDSIVATAPDGGWAIGTDGLLIPVVAGKAAQLICEADGDIDITITESAGKTCYLIIVNPSGKLVASAAITFAP